MENPNLYFDTVVEVFDPVRGRILASTRLDESLVALLGMSGTDMLSASSASSDHGGFQIIVRRLRITGPLPVNPRP